MAAMRFMIILAMAGAGIAYLVYYPYPDDCANMPMAMKAIQAMVRLIYSMCPISQALGGNFWTPLRITPIDPGKPYGVQVKKKFFAGIEVFFIRPDDIESNKSRSAMIFYHGGGWVTGTYATYALLTAAAAQKLGMMIVMPTYRLAPEHPFPTPFDDCLQFTKEFMANAEEFDVDPNKIVLMGDSAGGNLALAVALSLGEENMRSKTLHPDICMMSLIYPVTQMSNLMLPSYIQNANAPLLPARMMADFFLAYMGFWNYSNLAEPLLQNLHMEGSEGSDLLKRTSESWLPKKYRKDAADENPTRSEITGEMKQTVEKFKKMIQTLAFDTRFAPLTAEDAKLKLLPKTRIVTCEHDVLRDDGIILYERMKNLGLDVSHQNLQFGTHGLFALYGTTAYDELDQEMDILFRQIKDAVNKC